MAKYSKLTPKLALLLTAPHSWPAAIMPVLVALCATKANITISQCVVAIILMVISVLMQSSVNIFNDYFDFKNGTDSKSDYVDPSDSVLVYNNINPKHVLAFAITVLVLAFIFGIFIVLYAGIAPLIIGIIGAFFVVTYSCGPRPVSSLPIAELVSGVVMGGLICLASYCTLIKHFNLYGLVISIPTILSVALIMFSNNTSDIEKDTSAKRTTLPILLGRSKSCILNKVLILIWIVSIFLITAIKYTHGLVVFVIGIIVLMPTIVFLFKNKLLPENRIQTMGNICSANISINLVYCLAIAFAM